MAREENQRAIAPVDLLVELRRGFVAEGSHFRRQQELALSRFESLAMGAKAYAAETVVRKIDATLRDWA